jgi:osmotically-inducible protein OsmY
MGVRKAAIAIASPAILISALLFPALAQTQSEASGDKAAAQTISNALVQAGIDPRTTSVRVITTADHAVYLTGLISDRTKVKLAGDVAAKSAPSWRVVNNIRSSFFDDPNHVRGDKTK